MDELTKARERIDAIDEQIATLFNERQQISKEIAEIKKGMSKATLDLSREEQVLARAERIAGLYGRELFQTIMELSKKEQAKYR